MKTRNSDVKIGDYKINNFLPPFIIAEIGANHNGDLDLAKKTISAAKECGANAVKFQSWTPESLISKGEYLKNQNYTDSPKKHFGSLKEMVDKYSLNESQHLELKKYCDHVGIIFCSTPFSEKEADLLASLDVPFYKIASMDINNLRLLRHVAKKGKPVILSTGMSTLNEIECAVTAVESAGNSQIILLHCISIYPPEMNDVNLRNISMLQTCYEYPIGFSDHSIGPILPLASIVLGAAVIEKHFTLDKDLPGWDHAISSNPQELSTICTEAKNVHAALGTSRRQISKAESEKKSKFRRSLVMTRPMQKGEQIVERDLAFKRPGIGIQPDQIDFVVGRRLKSAKDQDDLLFWDDI